VSSCDEIKVDDLRYSITQIHIKRVLMCKFDLYVIRDNGKQLRSFNTGFNNHGLKFHCWWREVHVPEYLRWKHDDPCETTDISLFTA